MAENKIAKLDDELKELKELKDNNVMSIAQKYEYYSKLLERDSLKTSYKALLDDAIHN
jgi:hypothetical protein